MEKIIKSKLSLILIVSILLGNISLFSPVFSQEIETGLEEIEVLEENLKDIELVLEDEIELNQTTSSNNLDLRDDLKKLEKAESSTIEDSTIEPTSLMMVRRSFKVDYNAVEVSLRTKSIKSKLINLLDTIDILELERLKASYSAEVEIVNDISQIIGDVFSLYNNIASIKDFKTAVKSIKSIIKDLRLIRGQIHTLRMKFNINKINSNLNIRYIENVAKHLDKNLVYKQNDLKTFFIKRLDSSINKELLALEIKSNRMKIYFNKKDLSKLEARLNELIEIIDYTRQYIDANYESLASLDLNRYIDNLNQDTGEYAKIILSINSNLSYCKENILASESISASIKSLIGGLDQDISRLYENPRLIGVDDISNLNEDLSILDYYLSSESLGRDRISNRKEYKRIKKEISILENLLNINNQIDFLRESNELDEKSFNKKLSRLSKDINQLDKDFKSLYLGELTRFTSPEPSLELAI